MKNNYIDNKTQKVEFFEKKSIKEIEYIQAISYIFHMYDTRHHIFKFIVGINTVMIAIVFQYLSSDITKLFFSIISGVITLSLTFMAKRSFIYLINLEEYTKKLEEDLNIALITKPSSQMPKGSDSSIYLFITYYFLFFIWVLLSIYFLLRLLFPELPKL